MRSFVLENFNHFVIALFLQLVLVHRAYKKRWGRIVVCLGLMNARAPSLSAAEARSILSFTFEERERTVSGAIE